MPRVFIPNALQTLTQGVKQIEVEGANVLEVVDELERRFPGVKSRLCKDDALRTGTAVTVDGSVGSLGLLQPTPPDAEIHFLPALGGG